jgi:hypothetical protein
VEIVEHNAEYQRSALSHFRPKVDIDHSNTQARTRVAELCYLVSAGAYIRAFAYLYIAPGTMITSTKTIITPWKRIILEEPTTASSIKKFPVFHGPRTSLREGAACSFSEPD